MGFEWYRGGKWLMTGKMVPALRAVLEGREGGEEQVGPQDRIAQVEGAAAHELDQGQGDAPAQAGLLVGQGEHEGPEDEPDRRVGKPERAQAKAALGALKPGLASWSGLNRTYLASEDGHREAQEADGASGQGLQNQGHDHAANRAK